MATTSNRTTEDVRRDIEREREQLVHAVTNLRTDIHRVTDMKPLLKKVAIGAVAVTAVIVAFKISRRLGR
jgi:hypothetical protein